MKPLRRWWEEHKAIVEVAMISETHLNFRPRQDEHLVTIKMETDKRGENNN